MRYSPEYYSQALIELADGQDEDTLVKNFVGLMVKNGDIKYAAKIIAQLERDLTLKNKGKIIDIEIARKEAGEHLETLSGLVTDKDKLTIKETPSLIAGTRVTINNSQILDTSLKSSLRKILN